MKASGYIYKDNNFVNFLDASVLIQLEEKMTIRA